MSKPVCRHLVDDSLLVKVGASEESEGVNLVGRMVTAIIDTYKCTLCGATYTKLVKSDPDCLPKIY